MRRSVGQLVALAVIAAALFSQLRSLPVPAAFWLLILLVPFPLLVATQARAAADLAASLPRGRIYLDSILSLWTLAVITAGVAWWSGLSAAGLGLVGVPPLQLLAWAAGLTAGGLLVVVLAHALGMRETALLEHLIPRSPAEKAGFAALSLTAGICEEFIYRGFMLGALYAATGSLLLAVLVSSGAFGIVHAYQKPAGAARAATLGTLLALPMILTGSILPAVIAHTAIDLLAGLLIRERLLR